MAEQREGVEAAGVVDGVVRHPEVLEAERVGSLRNVAHDRRRNRIARSVGEGHSEGDRVLEHRHQTAVGQ